LNGSFVDADAIFWTRGGFPSASLSLKPGEEFKMKI